MQIIDLPRGMGKTTALLRWLHEGQDHVLLVSNSVQAETLMRAFASLGGTSLLDAQSRVVTPANLHTLRGRKVVVGIDELDSVLWALIGSPVAIATWTSEEQS